MPRFAVALAALGLAAANVLEDQGAVVEEGASERACKADESGSACAAAAPHGLAFSSEPKNDLTKGNKDWCTHVKKIAKGEKFDETCLRAVANQDAVCREAYEFVKKKQTHAAAYEKYTFDLPHNENCSTFKVKYSATYQPSPEVTRKIAEFVPKCEDWAKNVCKNHACPKYNTMRRIIEMKKDNSSDLPCDEAATCTPSLPGVGPNPLVRLLNEHLLKCICVYRQDDTSVCYEGGQGIPEGKLWCEFEGMPRWREMLEKTSNRKSEEKYKEALADLPRSACAGLK